MTNFNFDYGYIQKFPENIDGESEKKVKNSFFSSSIDTNTDCLNWIFHSAAINHGYIQKLYNYNFLNQSQFENPVIKEEIERTGINQIISSKLLSWEINDNEISRLEKSSFIKSQMIDLPVNENTFLKTEKAKEFNEIIKLKK